MKRTEVAYLATPYSHPDIRIQELRWRVVNWMAYWLIQQGQYVYSPITHNAPFHEWGAEAAFESWRAFDCSMVSRCDQLIVLTLPGWRESIGVTAEIEHAANLKIPINYLEPPYEELEAALGSLELLQLTVTL